VWTFAQEFFVLVHGTPSPSTSAGLWPMFLFGFVFIITQMHGLGLSRLARWGLRLSTPAPRPTSTPIAASPTQRDRPHPVIDYVLVFVLAWLIGGGLWIARRSARPRRRSSHVCPVPPNETRRAAAPEDANSRPNARRLCYNSPSWAPTATPQTRSILLDQRQEQIAGRPRAWASTSRTARASSSARSNWRWPGARPTTQPPATDRQRGSARRGLRRLTLLALDRFEGSAREVDAQVAAAGISAMTLDAQLARLQAAVDAGQLAQAEQYLQAAYLFGVPPREALRPLLEALARRDARRAQALEQDYLARLARAGASFEDRLVQARARRQMRDLILPVYEQLVAAGDLPRAAQQLERLYACDLSDFAPVAALADAYLARGEREPARKLVARYMHDVAEPLGAEHLLDAVRYQNTHFPDAGAST
jgi:hypothetical protein